jgi:thioredoxin reductase (NADPH)
VRWKSRIRSINPQSVIIGGHTDEEALPASRVYLMTGFAPNMELLAAKGVPIDATTGIPSHDPETLETAVPGIFIAGVVVAGYDANKVFIENGRFHGDRIVARITGSAAPPEPTLSAELDT